jgi:hypothetical protein
MAIDYRALRSLTAREITNALIRDGFVLDRQRGSHRHYYHPERQAHWSEADLRRLKLTNQQPEGVPWACW